MDRIIAAFAALALSSPVVAEPKPKPPAKPTCPVWLGMKQAEMKCARKPDRIFRTTSVDGDSETWTYATPSGSMTLYFRNGYLRSIHRQE